MNLSFSERFEYRAWLEKGIGIGSEPYSLMVWYSDALFYNRMFRFKISKFSKFFS